MSVDWGSRRQWIVIAAVAAALCAASCASTVPGKGATALEEARRELPADSSAAPEGTRELTAEEARAKALLEAAMAEAEAAAESAGTVESTTETPVPNATAPSSDDLYMEAQLPDTSEPVGISSPQRISYPEELFGMPLVRSLQNPGIVTFFYPLRSAGGVTVTIDDKTNAIKVGSADGKQVDDIITFLSDKFLEKQDGGDIQEIKHFKNRNLLQITTKEENVPLVLEALEFLDTPSGEVIIEASVWEITESQDEELGASVGVAKAEGAKTFFSLFSTNHDTLSFLESLAGQRPYQGSILEFVQTADGNNANMTAVFRFLKTRGYADLVASPRMRVAVGEVAKIVTVEEYPMLYVRDNQGRLEIKPENKPKEVGVTLYVVPMSAGHGTIKVAVAPKVTEIIGYTDASVTGIAYPIIARRESATKVFVSNRELITIGGLDQTRKVITEKKVPLLGDIPLLKYLFRSRRETTKKVQLWFTVRPTLVGETERLILPEYTGTGSEL